MGLGQKTRIRTSADCQLNFITKRTSHIYSHVENTKKTIQFDSHARKVAPQLYTSVRLNIVSFVGLKGRRAETLIFGFAYTAVFLSDFFFTSSGTWCQQLSAFAFITVTC